MALYETRVHRDTLQKIAAEQEFEDPKIEIKAITPRKAKYTTQVFLATISGNNRDALHTFLKVGLIGEKARPVPKASYYNTEFFMYLDLVNIYKLIEKKKNLPFKHRLKLPNFYAANTYLPTYIPDCLEEVLVLENLAEKGYSSFNRTTSVDWPFAAAAVNELAKLHALSMAFEDENPEDFERVLQDYQMPKVHKAVADVQFKRAIAEALAVVKAENKSRLENTLMSMNFDDYRRLMASTKHPVIVHGDYRPRNMMYKKKDVRLSFQKEDLYENNLVI